MTYKVGVIGTGAIGVEHALRINQRIGGANVVAVTDIDGEIGRASCRERV